VIASDVETGADQLVIREKFAAACLTNIFEMAMELPDWSKMSSGTRRYLLIEKAAAFAHQSGLDLHAP